MKVIKIDIINFDKLNEILLKEKIQELFPEQCDLKNHRILLKFKQQKNPYGMSTDNYASRYLVQIELEYRIFNLENKLLQKGKITSSDSFTVDKSTFASYVANDYVVKNLINEILDDFKNKIILISKI